MRDGPNPQIAVLNLGQPLAAATANGVGTSIFFLASSACSCSSALGRRLELATAARINALQPQLAFEHPLLPPQSRATCWNLAASATATGLTLSFCCFLLLMPKSLDAQNKNFARKRHTESQPMDTRTGKIRKSPTTPGCSSYQLESAPPSSFCPAQLAPTWLRFQTKKS